jgi:hypothetical protein
MTFIQNRWRTSNTARKVYTGAILALGVVACVLTILKNTGFSDTVEEHVYGTNRHRRLRAERLVSPHVDPISLQYGTPIIAAMQSLSPSPLPGSRARYPDLNNRQLTAVRPCLPLLTGHLSSTDGS